MERQKVDHVLVLEGFRFWRRSRIGPKGVVVGRHRTCDLRLDSAQAPRRAFRVDYKTDGYYVSALAPDTDLWVGERKVLQSKLQDGDVLRCCGQRMRYVRTARSRVVLIPLLSLLVVALVALAAAYRFSDSYYRRLALSEFNKGNTAALEQYVDAAILDDVQTVLDDREVIEAVETITPDIPVVAPVVSEDTFEGQVLAAMRGLGIENPEIDQWALSRVERWVNMFTRNKVLVGTVQRAINRSVDVSDMVIRKLQASVLPDHLIFLAFAESNFQAAVKSHAGAQGLWQFMPGTGRDYNLLDRTDPVSSTDSAIAYLTDLTAIFGPQSILMSMAAYNCGDGNVRRCLRRAVSDPYRERNFWHLSRTGCLPEETQEYVPKILALAVIGSQPERYGFTTPPGYQLSELRQKKSGATISSGDFRTEPEMQPVKDAQWTQKPTEILSGNIKAE